MNIIVQRHALRVAMSNASVLDSVQDLSTPVYIVAARDDVVTTEADTAEAVRQSLFQHYDFRKTGCLQSVLMLYVGARMLLHGKDCISLGLMNGTEVEIVCIQLSDQDLGTCYQSKDNGSNIITLTHMPHSVLVRVVGAKWILPEEVLPELPKTMDRRGASM